MELTKEHFDQSLKGFATKDDLKDLATKAGLAEVRNDVAAVKKGMADFVTSEELQKVSTKVDDIVTILDRQTTVLDGVAKDVKDWNTEMVMVRARLDRHDQWFKQMAEHINIKLQN